LVVVIEEGPEAFEDLFHVVLTRRGESHIGRIWVLATQSHE
jgi:hypothetical protein